MTTVGLDIRDAVHDAYRSRYLDLDPARYLLRRRFTEPLFSAQEFSAPSQACAGAIGTASAYPRLGPMSAELRQSFLRYRREFLLPNDFYYHLGFCFQDAGAKHTFFLDFHRAKASLPFNERDVVRAKIIAMVLHARSSGVNDRHGSSTCGKAFLPDNREGFSTLSEFELRRYLSTREIEVAEAVAQGLSNKEVGATLDISVRTVENHLRSIFSKLGINTRTRLVARVHELRGQAQGAAS